MSTRFRVGVYGTGRGTYLARLFARHDDVQIAAGCDFDPARLASFASSFPDARLFRNYADLLAVDLDILVLASYIHDHGPDAVKALQAGKDVFSAITAFHTPAEGVALVEAVEKSGRQYMMDENHCYAREILEMRRLFREGILGDFLYGECEYVHDIRNMMVRNADGSYHWRAWLPAFYYNTHSLGPMLEIANARPVSVIGQAVESRIAGCRSPIDFAVSLVRLSSGALVRVLLSFSAVREPYSVWYNLYGTQGAVESDRWEGGVVHVYREGDPLVECKHRYVPRFPVCAEEAARAGHGGGDFYTVHLFLEALRNGTPLPIDVYQACDFTLPGILAYRSWVEGGRCLEVPDLSDPAVRERYRNDHFRCPQGEAVREG